MLGLSRFLRWFRSGRTTPAANPIDAVASALQIMGYDLTPYGAGVALLQLQSGYTAVEVASHLAHTTLAQDVRKCGQDIDSLVAFLPHAKALLRILKEYKDSGAMREAQWKNDSTAVWGIVAVGPEQRAWLEQVLSDPIATKELVAHSRISYTNLRP